MARASAARDRTQSKAHLRTARANQNQDKAQVHAQESGPSVHPVEPPVEPEDAQITGTSRSLQRRVMGLNVEDRQQHPETAAGQHATGSFTGDRGKPKNG
ncbi:MAG TPA: hypothetical protein VHX60_17560 [Acidobacteriaceae bacterium]|jgi:hypothetical protein|nr:hypothetical protein [Acidobacteriaceae bacterium]